MILLSYATLCKGFLEVHARGNWVKLSMIDLPLILNIIKGVNKAENRT